MPSEITKAVLVDAPASAVFRALTDEKELVQWMLKAAKIDARVGGEYEFNFYSAVKKTETPARGRIVELVPNRKLAYTLASGRDATGAPPSLLTWTLEEGSDGKTTVTLVHSGFGGDSYRDFLAWGYYIERLAAHCSRKPAAHPMSTDDGHRRLRSYLPSSSSRTASLLWNSGFLSTSTNARSPLQSAKSTGFSFAGISNSFAWAAMNIF